KLYFPSVREAASAPSLAEPEQPTRAHGGRVLIVEDDPLVREMARRSLAEAGYAVVEAANGQTALDLVSRDPGIDAVLTDLAMPGIGGRELARRLRESRPGLPVVFMSGYTDDVVIRRGLLESGVPFLEKPLSPVKLAQKMRQVLDGGTL
ncbi:MAG: response regulator, partial [Gemmatimonadales bacterium]